MLYNFPTINNIDDVLPHINKYEEIKVYEKDWYIVVDYVVALENTFSWDTSNILGSAIRRECRGLLFDKKTGVIISRPYHKFFNIGEKEETQFNAVDLNSPHIILDKLDGSMVRPIPSENGYSLGTRAGVTDVSKQAEEFINGKANYNTFISKCIQKNVTPIFEWTSRKTRIVLDYPEDNLILTAIRYNNSGEYTNYKVMKDYANAWGIPVVVVSHIDSHNEYDVKSIVLAIRGWLEYEGVIIRFNSGHMLKSKCDDYVLKHKGKDQISLEKNVVKLILNDSVDDMIPILYEGDVERLINFKEGFWKSVDEVCGMLTEMFDSANTSYPDQKEFSVEFVLKMKLSKPLAGIMYAMKSGKTAREIVLNKIEKSTTSQTKIDENRWLFGNLKWN